MMPSTKTANRVIVFLLYSGIVALTLYAGASLINNSLDSKFYRDYLIKWDVAVRSLNAKGFPWPKLSPKKHMEYMAYIVEAMQSNSIEVPKSNTNYPWIYRINKVWAPTNDLFTVCLYNKIITYGVPESTLMKIEKYSDGSINFLKGRFVALETKNKENFTGVLRL